MIVATGFLIKYAFDRGWISPTLRVAAGVIGGMAVASYGESLHRRQMRRFGGALIGAGAGITYLALWAAAGPYELVRPELGILALLLVSALVTASAVNAGTEYLAALACGGALLAPIVIGVREASPELLVLYTGIVAVSSAAVAIPRRWRTTVAVSLAGYFLIPLALGGSAHAALLVSYDILGGAAALLLVRSRGWRGLEATAFVLAWLAVAAVASEVDGGGAWLLWLMLPILVAPSFWDYARRVEPEHALPRLEEAIRDPAMVSFVLSAILWAGLTLIARPGAPDSYYPLPLLAAIALPYLAVGARRLKLVPHALAFGIAAWGAWSQFDGIGVRAAWGALALASAITTRASPLAKNRWIGPMLAAAAAYDLLAVDYELLDPVGHVFLGAWALTLYFLIAVLAAMAGPLWGEEGALAGPRSPVPLRRIVWILAGLTLLAGGTELILLHFGRSGAGATRLVADLTVSGFWLAYAAILLAFGFLQSRREVRIAGLVMTGLAIVKVAFYDLTQLRALYRVASFFLLALIALGAAYAYHRRGQDKPTGPSQTAS